MALGNYMNYLGIPRLREPKKGIFKKFVNLDTFIGSSFPDPDPEPDLHVFGPPGSGSIPLTSGSRSFYHHAKIVRKTLIPSIL